MSAASGGADAGEIARIASIHALQSAAFAADPYPDAASRRRRLKALRAALRRHQDTLADAMGADFGGRSPFESKMADVLYCSHALLAITRTSSS